MKEKNWIRLNFYDYLTKMNIYFQTQFCSMENLGSWKCQIKWFNHTGMDKSANCI